MKIRLLSFFLLRNAHRINSSTGVGFLFVFKAWQQAYSKLRNCCHNTEDRQKDKLVVKIILCTFLISVTNTLAALETFDEGKIGTVQDNWKVGITGKGDSDWKLEKDNSAPSSPLVLKQSAEGDFPWCINKNSNLSDGFVAVKFKAISGKEDQAAGLIWRWKDANNYYVARANALENNVSIYYVKDGQRKTIKYEDVPDDLPVKLNVWQNLRVDFKNNHFTVSFEGKKIIDIMDDNIKGKGSVGLWTKADSVTSFDDFIYSETGK